jgi:signal transduction histidine kinase
MLFQQIGDRENVVYHANKLLELALELGDPETEIRARWILVMDFDEDQDQEKLDYSLELYKKSLSLNTIYTDYIAGECGILFLNLNRPREALPFLHRVEKSYDAGARGFSIAAIYFSLAEAYALLNRVDSAEYYLKKSQEGHIMFDKVRITTDYARSLIEAAKGNYRGALESFKKYQYLSDSIEKAGKTTEIARMKNWQELEQKEKEKEILQQEGQKQHRLILILAGALILILALLALSVLLYRKTTEKNRELKKLHAVKDKLFSVVAHDLRNPMGALMSVLKLANKNMLDAETQAQLLKDISARVDDTYSLLDNLLHWSKSQMQGIVPAPVCFDAQEGSRAVTDRLQAIAAHKNIVLNNRIEKQQIYIDRDMFAVVVRNLTMNAIKYTPEVGEITLASELKDNMLIISVRDNGTGMSPEVQKKLFKLAETRSQRGTNNESGTGLGLVLCADFVKINGGNIWFTSIQSEGSTFFFNVPVK